MNYRVRYLNHNDKEVSSKRMTSAKYKRDGSVVAYDGEGKYRVETAIYTKATKPRIEKEVCIDDFYGKYKWVEERK